jgi:hypothetical protein
MCKKADQIRLSVSNSNYDFRGRQLLSTLATKGEQLAAHSLRASANRQHGEGTGEERVERGGFRVAVLLEELKGR